MDRFGVIVTQIYDDVGIHERRLRTMQVDRVILLALEMEAMYDLAA